jgi:hypothetical protein
MIRVMRLATPNRLVETYVVARPPPVQQIPRPRGREMGAFMPLTGSEFQQMAGGPQVQRARTSVFEYGRRRSLPGRVPGPVPPWIALAAALGLSQTHCRRAMADCELSAADLLDLAQQPLLGLAPRVRAAVAHPPAAAGRHPTELHSRGLALPLAGSRSPRTTPGPDARLQSRSLRRKHIENPLPAVGVARERLSLRIFPITPLEDVMELRNVRRLARNQSMPGDL